MLILSGVLTNSTSFFFYNLEEWVDASPNAPVDGMLYDGSTLADCYVWSLVLTHSVSTIQDQVRTTINRS